MNLLYCSRSKTRRLSGFR